jgi:DNA repair protein SbcC/Rad50
MRLEYLAVKGMGPFRGEAHVDLSNLRGIIALCGENGTGKTTFLECYAAALRRKLPTCGKGTLASIASGRDSYVEARVVNGSAYTIRQMVDAVSGKGESMVLDANGLPVLENAKVTAYDTWASKHLPPEDVFFASMFSAQRSHGFLEMGETERQATLLKTLGVERYEAMAKQCREKAAATSGKLSTNVARIRDAEARGGSVEAAEPALEAAKEAADRCACDLDNARAAAALASDALVETQAELAKLQAESAAIGREIAEHERMAAECNARREEAKTRAEAAKAEMAAKLRDARAKVADVEARLANNKRLLDDADAIRDAVAQDRDLAKKVEELAAMVATLKADAQRWAERESAAVKARTLAESRYKAASERAASLKARLETDERAVRDALDQLPELEASLAKAETAVSIVRDGVAMAEEAAGVTTDERITVLRGALRVIAIDALDPGDDPSSVASRAIASDDAKIEMQKDAPARLKAARAELRAADIARQAAQDALADAKRRAAQGDRLDALRADLETANAAMAQAGDESYSEGVILAECEQGIRLSRAALAERETDLRTVREERSALLQLVSKAERLAVAEERIGALEDQLCALQQTIADAEEAAPLSEPPEAVRAGEEAAEHLRRAKEAKDRRVDALESLDMAKAKATKQTAEKTDAARAVADAESLDRSAHASLVLAQQALDRAKETEGALKALWAERKTLEDELSDWTLLAESLGVDGLQALEVDSAAGELTSLVNDLLHSCFGSRWTVSLETTRSSADGKKQIETCRVTVLDNEQGIEPSRYRPSGGQAVIIDEAISLALSMLACRRSGAQGVTLVRDESGAALDPENAKNYVAMLRRAAEYVGAKNVLLVSHSPAVQDLADAKILVKDGKLEVVS